MRTVCICLHVGSFQLNGHEDTNLFIIFTSLLCFFNSFYNEDVLLHPSLKLTRNMVGISEQVWYYLSDVLAKDCAYFFYK